jgi:hypothetical protein
MNNPKIKERLLKLLALAQRGVGGEKKNAQRFLERELKKHGLTIADLDDSHSPTIDCLFSFKNKTERQLLVQILCMVTQSKTISSRRPRNAKKILVELTTVQKFEVDMFYSAYKRDLAKTLDNALTAFIAKNHIYSGVNSDEPEQSTLSKEDEFEIMLMMEGIRKTEVRQGISRCDGSD